MFRVKICGVTTPEDGQTITAAGADAIGLNFYEKSKRFILPERAANIVQVSEGVLSVGVFVNSPLKRVVQIAENVALNAIQLHGDESAQFAEKVSAEIGLPVMRAFRAESGDEPEIIDYVAEFPGLAGVLIDAAVAGQFGGTGHTGDWDFVAAMVKRLGIPVVVAGGLVPNNVAAAIQSTGAYGVDTASGVESSAGSKDPLLVREFVTAARFGRT